jgi:hypothetical protein
VHGLLGVSPLHFLRRRDSRSDQLLSIHPQQVLSARGLWDTPDVFCSRIFRANPSLDPQDHCLDMRHAGQGDSRWQRRRASSAFQGARGKRGTHFQRTPPWLSDLFCACGGPPRWYPTKRKTPSVCPGFPLHSPFRASQSVGGKIEVRRLPGRRLCERIRPTVAGLKFQTPGEESRASKSPTSRSRLHAMQDNALRRHYKREVQE